MTPLEKAEINRLPDRYKPIGAWGYFLYSLLFALPIVGLIFVIVFSVSDKNVNRRSFARGILLSMAVAVVISVVFAVLVIVGLIPFDYFSSTIN